MKFKLIQILLGAFGSALTVLLTHFANIPADIAVSAALGAGPATTALLGDVVQGLIEHA